MTWEVHRFTDENGDELVVDEQMTSATLTICAAGSEGADGMTSVYLPTEPDEVEALLRAIVKATGCRLAANPAGGPGVFVVRQ